MSKLIELATDIVASHASTTAMTKEELLAEIKEVFSTLAALDQVEEAGLAEGAETGTVEENVPAVSKRKAFGNDKIYCMICGKGFTTLKRHLNSAHQMTAKEYKEKFDIPASTSLAAKNYVEGRRQMAIDKGLAGNLAKAREAKKSKK
ncbi:MAG: MucR family transcriptional regulator [Pelovirga sp.]